MHVQDSGPRHQLACSSPGANMRLSSTIRSVHSWPYGNIWWLYCTRNSILPLPLPYFMFRTITIPVQPQPKILHSKSSRTKTHHVLAHLTTLICLEHKSSWVAQLPRVPSAAVRTQDLWREAPAPSQLRGCHLRELRQQEWECESRAEIILWSTDSTEIPASQWAC